MEIPFGFGQSESENERKKRLQKSFDTMIERKLNSLKFAIGDRKETWEKVIKYAKEQQL